VNKQSFGSEPHSRVQPEFDESRNGEDRMSNKNVARQYLESADRRDTDALRETLSPDVRVWVPKSVVARGVAEPIQGADAVVRFLTHGGNYQPNSQGWKMHQFVEEGEHIAVRLSRIGTLHDGSPYRNTYHFFFEFEGNKIVNVWFQLDTVTAFAELPAVGPDGLPTNGEAN
jgi:ketosteroid isomerase-like protein